MTFATRPEVLLVQDVIKDDDVSTWDQVWKLGVTPWDSGSTQPPLQEIIESGQVAFPHGNRVSTKPRALVPGCGTGYDVIFLAEALDADVVGLDASPTASKAAQQHLQARGPLSSGNATFRVDDFFALKPADSDKFDIIYDYTFFCAIPPAQRPQWASQMASLLRPGGYLITLVFPIDPPITTGPPYTVRPSYYEDALLEGFRKDGGKDKFAKLVDMDPETSTPAHKGRERMMVWRRLDD